MKITMCIAVLILFLINTWSYMSKNLHIFQLNHYKESFQLKWIRKNIKQILGQAILYVIPAIVILINNYYGLFIGLFAFILAIYLNRPKTAKKPLVYTSRIKRLIVTGYILILIAIILTKDIEKIILLISIISMFIPILILLLNFINKPINSYINKRCVLDARRIISSMKNLTVIGITGSYGKTSTKNFLYKILSEKYNVLMTPASYNTLLGVTITIRKELKATHDIFICEMGADKVGEIKEICNLVKPKYGIITSIGEQHLETFKTIDNIIKTKFELADSLPLNGQIFLNYDNENIRRHKTDKKIVTYGTEKKYKEEYLAENIKAVGDSLTFDIITSSKDKQSFTTNVLGRHNITNITGCIAVASKLGMSLKQIATRVSELKSVEHRLELKKAGENLIIDDAFNSNPSGAKSALETLSLFSQTKILLTPGMIELGEKEYECNFEFGKQAGVVCDYIILVGEKQTKAIYDGVLKTKFDKNKLIVVSNLQEGFKKINEIKVTDKKVILIENDLPDNY